jgi:hypothetical protein
MKLYGLYVWTHHGWGTVLTVMSPAGANAAFAHIETDEDSIAHSRPCQGRVGRQEG